MNDRQHALHALHRRAEPLRDLAHRLAQVARLIDPVDQRVADQPVCRIDDRERELLLQMFRQSHLRGDVGFEVRRLFVASPSARSGPRCGGQAGIVMACLGRGGSAVRVERIVHLGAQFGGEARCVRRKRFLRPVAFAAPAFAPVAGAQAFSVARVGLPFRVPDVPGVRRSGGRLMVAGLLRALKQGVALKLLLDVGGKLHVGVLKKLDRLQQLRRHDQGLALAEHQPR